MVLVRKHFSLIRQVYFQAKDAEHPDSDGVITLIDDVLDILAELVREEADDGEDDETSEDARTDIAYRHDHRVSEITTSMLRSL